MYSAISAIAGTACTSSDSMQASIGMIQPADHLQRAANMWPVGSCIFLCPLVHKCSSFSSGLIWQIAAWRSAKRLYPHQALGVHMIMISILQMSMYPWSHAEGLDQMLRPLLWIAEPSLSLQMDHLQLPRNQAHATHPCCGPSNKTTGGSAPQIGESSCLVGVSRLTHCLLGCCKIKQCAGPVRWQH